jgi:hypothetical protein
MRFPLGLSGSKRSCEVLCIRSQCVPRGVLIIDDTNSRAPCPRFGLSTAGLEVLPGLFECRVADVDRAAQVLGEERRCDATTHRLPWQTGCDREGMVHDPVLPSGEGVSEGPRKAGRGAYSEETENDGTIARLGRSALSPVARSALWSFARPRLGRSAISLCPSSV